MNMVEPVQDEHENIADNENNESLQSPPDIDGLCLPHQPRSPIKIICKFHVCPCISRYNVKSYIFIYAGPNGEVRQIKGNSHLQIYWHYKEER
jgi:hypothetical protein